MFKPSSFGYWVLRRRKALNLTRNELARRVGCATVTIKKIERDERRPSRQIAELLANALALLPEEEPLFLKVARGERSFDRLKLDSTPLTLFPRPLHNLPVQSTSFIGRQDEIANLKARLGNSQVRLCTILGPGGIGKTRLALQVASELVDSYPGGVWLVELAPLSNPRLIFREISTALGVLERPNHELSMVLVDFLKSRLRLLLVLDNCEHLLKAVADLSSLLLKNCPNLQILATSRQTLGLEGEAIWPIIGLSLPANLKQPSENQAFDIESLTEHSEAIRLFVERGRQKQPHFHLTTQNFSVVVEICRRLDRMPLAIELAAARMNVLSVDEILVHLNECFHLLRSKSRDIEERHQTLYSVVDWSYQLLTEAERLFFNRLAVFRGSFILEAAETVGRDLEIAESSTILDLLSSLVEKSMVLVETGGPIGTRYRLLETLRLYGQERLIESGEVEIFRQRHAMYFAHLAEEADPQLRGPEQVAWLEYLELDHDNFRIALEWTEKNDTVAGLRLASALWWFWITRGYFTEGKEWMERFFAAERDSVSDIMNVKAYIHYVCLMSYLLDNQQLYKIAEEGLRRAKLVEDLDGMAISLLMMAGDPYYASDLQKSRSLLEESLILFRQCGDKWGAAYSLRTLAALSETHLRNHEEARRLLSESMALFREIGDLRGISGGLFMFGEIERHLGNWDSANSYYQESLSYRRGLNDRYSMAHVLWKMGAVAEYQNEYIQATKLREASLLIFREINHQEMIAIVLGNLAYSAFLAGQNDRALELSNENLRLSKEINNERTKLQSLVTLGEFALTQSDTTTAFQYFRDALVIVREHRLPRNHIVYGLEALARLAICQKQIERAVKFLSAAEMLRDMIGLILYPNIREKWESSLNQARANLDEATFIAARDEGYFLAEAGWENIIAYALGEVEEE